MQALQQENTENMHLLITQGLLNNLDMTRTNKIL